MPQLACAMAIMLGIATAENPFAFRSWVISSRAIGVRSIGQGDIDGDGDIDLMSADFERLSWYENTGGALPAYTDHTIAEVPDYEIWDAFLVDIDGDGDLDILSALPETEVLSWYENDGGPTPSFTHHAIAEGLTSVSNVSAADLDQDSDVDVIVTVEFNDQHDIVVFLNDGNAVPSFNQMVIDASYDIRSLSAADLNADQHIDLLACSSASDAVLWYENVGAQLPGFQEHIITANAGGPVDAFAADIDGDLDMDILVAEHDADSLSWHVNDGGKSPTFDERRLITNEEDDVRTVYATDMDGDGDIDILSGRSSATVTWHENNGNDPPKFTLRLVDSTTHPTFGILAADFDDDGDLDIVSADTRDDRVQWYERGGDPLLPFTQHNLSLDEESPQPVAVVDLDGDGDNDFLARRVVPSLGDIVGWWESDGAVPPNFELRIISTTAVRVQFVAYADLDGDGDLDVLSTSQGDPRLAWYEQIPAEGGKQIVFVEHAIMKDESIGGPIVPADLDDDGDVDLITAGIHPTRIIWLDNDGGQPPSFTERIIHDAFRPEAYSAIDVDGDGDLDVIALEDSYPTWYENDGQTIPSFIEHVLPCPIYAEDPSFKMADLDADGDLDLILGDGGCFPVLQWCENIGGKPLQFDRHIIRYFGGNVGGTADVDGDGDIDLLTNSNWYEQSPGKPLAFTNRPFINQANDAVREMFPTSDIDGDGDIDLLASFVNSDTKAWFENKGATIIAASSIRTHGTTDLPIDLFASHGIEPRIGGPRRLRLQTSAPLDAESIADESVTVTCAGAPIPHTIIPVAADTIELALGETVTDATCCTLHFPGLRSVDRLPVTSPLKLRVLAGDLNFDGAVTGGDALLIKPHFGEIAGQDLAAPQWDFNVDGAVTGGDYALIKPRFGHVVPSCP